MGHGDWENKGGSVDQWEYVQTRTTPPFKAALAGKEGGYHSDQLL